MKTIAGPTTGDEIMDFLAWMWPKSYEEALPHYRALAERLKGRKGQFVLMIERREESRGGCVRSFGPPVEETFTLGVLTDDRLKLERVGESAFRGKLSFPTASHAVDTGSHWRRDGLADGDVKPQFFDTLFFAKIGKPMEISHHDNGGCFGSSGMSTDFCLGAERDQPMSELDFVVGNDEIEAWCRRGAMHYKKHEPNGLRCDLIRRMARQLGASTDGIAAVRTDTELNRNVALAKVRELEGRREEIIAQLEDPESRIDARKLVDDLRTIRRDSAAAVERAAELGIADEPSVKRLRQRLTEPAK